MTRYTSLFVQPFGPGIEHWEWEDSEYWCELPPIPLSDLELLELGTDTPVGRSGSGTRRPQALRQARARRSAFLRRF
jgi:hypothetical protein